ncbi:MAG: hypothetical protein ACKVQA_24075 [Burkholderiales bacterium]
MVVSFTAACRTIESLINERRNSMFSQLRIAKRGGFVPVLASLLSLGTPAFAEETVCRGTFGAVTLDNIFVPDGAFCTLTGTTAKGNIVVGTGSTLSATRVSVNGNVQAEGARSVSVLGGSSVGGSVQIVQGGAAVLDWARINGDVLLDSNNGPLSATRLAIGGNLQAFENSGGVKISNNVMKGNLQCKANTPAPTGGGNRAQQKEDQCERL